MEDPICWRFCRKEMRIIILFPILFLAAYLYPYLPGHDLPLCAIKIGTGFDCPGCGMVRSISAFLHGRFAESFGFHPFGVIVVAWMFYVWLKTIYNTYENERDNRDRNCQEVEVKS